MWTPRLASTAFTLSGTETGRVTHLDLWWAKRAIVKVGVANISGN